MVKKARRVALMLELRSSYKRHADIFAGTQRYAQEQGWESILDEFVEKTLSAVPVGLTPYDGIIARADRKLAGQARRRGVPVVNVWLTSPAWKELPGVFPDFTASGAMRAEHLLSRGLRHFAALAREERGAKIEVAAFADTVRKAGCPCIIETLPLDPMSKYVYWQKSQARLEAWMSQWQPPMGVFVYADEVGRMIPQLCQQRGWRVPQDVALICGSNEEPYCLHPRPSLSSVERGYETVGYEAAKLLDTLMNRSAKERSQGAELPQQILVPPRGLVIRESTDFFAVNDELVAAALKFIAANFHRQIGQNDVARAVSAETRTLQSHFRKVLDRPIVAVIRQVRIERAKRELVQSSRTLRQIAHDVGFGAPARMNDVFRRELGVTPNEYRKQRQL